jgi:diacylglycerol O-acyltransferase
VSYELLRPQDATLLYAQDPRAPLQIGALALFEAGPLRDDDAAVRIDAIRRHVETRLRGTRFRQRLVGPAFGLGAAVWVDDPDFAVGDHVRVAALPRPGDTATLRELMARLLETPLDPARPLWEIWVVEGVEGDRIAVIPKVSHVMADGTALLDFMVSVLDLEPGPSAPRAAAMAEGAAPPGRAQVLARGAIQRTRRQLARSVGLLGGLRRPVRTVSTGFGLARSALAARPAPPSPINRPVGRRRDMTWMQQPMPELQRLKRAQGVSLNDVVLAAVAGAWRDVLGGGSDPPAGAIHPRALVPVSTHVQGAETAVENRFSLLLAELPVSVDDPLERLQRVHAEMVRRKRSAEVSIGSILLAVSDLVPAGLIRLLAPSILGRQPVVNLAVTNLPGTDQPLYLLGSRLREAYPFVTVIGNISLIVGVVSYGDSLGVGITVDPDVVDDVDAFAGALDRAFGELVAAATAAGAGGQARLDDRG